MLDKFRTALTLATLAADKFGRALMRTAAVKQNRVAIRSILAALLISLAVTVMGTTQSTGLADHIARRAPLNDQVEDERLLVAIDWDDACSKQMQSGQQTATRTCKKAEASYRAAHPIMVASVLEDRIREADYTGWIIELNKSLRLQRSERASNVPQTAMEKLWPFALSTTGICLIAMLFIVLPLAAAEGWLTKQRPPWRE